MLNIIISRSVDHRSWYITKCRSEHTELTNQHGELPCCSEAGQLVVCMKLWKDSAEWQLGISVQLVVVKGD